MTRTILQQIRRDLQLRVGLAETGESENKEKREKELTLREF
jgi:hypothetical protein